MVLNMTSSKLSGMKLRNLLAIAFLGMAVVFGLIWFWEYYNHPASIIARNDAEYLMARIEKGKIDPLEIKVDHVAEAVQHNNPELIRALIQFLQNKRWREYESFAMVKAISYLEDKDLKSLYFSRFKRDKDGFLKMRLIERFYVDMDAGVIKTLLEAGLNPNQSLYVKTDKSFIDGAYQSKITLNHRWTVEPGTYRGSRMVLKPFIKMKSKTIPIPGWVSDQELKDLIGHTVTFTREKYRRESYLLLQAAEQQNLTVVRLLLEYGADQKVVGSNGETVYSLLKDNDARFLVRSWGKQLDPVEEIITRDDLNAYREQPRNQSSSVVTRHLTTAVENGAAAVTAYLLNQKKVILKANDWPLLVSAYESRNPLVVDLVLAYGIDINHTIKRRQLPEKYQPKKRSPLSMVFMAASGRKLSSKEEKLRESVTIGNALIAIAEKEMQMETLFVLNGHKLEWNDFFLAVLSKQFETAEQLLAENPRLIGSKDRRGFTPLAAAAFYGESKAAQFLIDHGADVNTVDNSGRYPIFYAVDYGHPKMTRLLVENGALLTIPKYPDCAFIPLYAEQIQKRKAPIEKIFNAFKKFRGGRKQLERHRYYEIRKLLLEATKKKGLPLCKKKKRS